MSMPDNDKSSEEIEREVEQTRTRVSQTLEELRDRMSPGQVMDDLMDYARGGGEFVNALGRTMRENPMPVLLIGAGLAWLATAKAMPKRETHASVTDLGYAEGRRHPAMTERESGLGTRVSGAVSSATSSVGDTASSVYESMTQTAGRVGERASSAGREASRYAAQAGERASRAMERAQKGFLDLAQEQPLVFGAIGLALGAMLGMALPTTETEDELLGRTSDALKQEAKELGREGYETAKAAATRAAEEVKGEAGAQQGSNPDMPGRTAQTLGDKLSAVAGAATEGAKEEAESRTRSKT